MTETRDPWLTTLEEGAQLLQAGKPEEAARALSALSTLCDPAAPRPSPAIAAQARDLLQRCFDAEASLRQRVAQDLNCLATGKRAQAYRHPGQGPR